MGKPPFHPENAPASPSGSGEDIAQELAEEAFADLLRKHGRPVDLRTALRQSVGHIEKRQAAPSGRRRAAATKARQKRS